MPLRKIILSLIGIFLVLFPGFSQTLFLKGKVINEKTRETLPFVNIGIAGTQRGTSSDIDGRFSIIVPENARLAFTYVGYEPFTLDVKTDQTFLVITLQERTTELTVVTIRPGDNPALRIIRKAAENKVKNDPGNLPSFSYNSYNKLYSTLGESTGPVEKLKGKDSVKLKKDSLKLKNFAENNHLFLIESYTERKFVKPNFSKEIVLGNRMSGIKDPFFSFLATDFQPFSFYNDFIGLFGKNYLNPVSEGSDSKYDFTLVDTVYHARDSVFVITFEPLPGKSFEGMKGQVYISSDGYAIEHVLATPADDKVLIEAHIQQKYQKVDGHWFPVQLNTELHFKAFNFRGYKLSYASRSYLTNIHIGEPITKKEFDLLNVEFDPEANHRSEEFWNQHRFDTLGRKEKNTYQLFDSLADKLKALNNMMAFTEGLLVGKFKAGKFYVPIEYLSRFNQYEDIRFGIGLQTGERISKLFTLESYAGYGLRDKALKYGGAVQLNIDRSRDVFFKVSYMQDILEPGRAGFMKGKGAINGAENLRDWLSARMDSVEQLRAEFGFRPFRFSQISLYMQQQNRNPAYVYTFDPYSDATRVKSKFNITEVGIQGRFAINESYTQIGQSKVVTNLAYPQINITASQSVSGLLDGDYKFSKVEMKVDEQFTVKSFGKTTFQVSSGYAWGQIPYPYLFNGKGTTFDKSFSEAFFVTNYFQTMGLYEFASDRYAYLFLNHNFGRLTTTKSSYFRPELSIVQNIGVGSLQDVSAHQGVSFKTMEKGYYESGLMLSNLLRFKYVHMLYWGLGVGAFYRYGEYALPNASDNLALKIIFSISF